MAERERWALAVGTVLCVLLLTSVGTVTAQPDCSMVIYDEDAEGNRLVEDVEQLQCIADNPVSDYKLDNDIDARDTFEWNGGAGFEPIGVTFRGTFDGDGYSVNELNINRANESEVGLFASTGGNAVVENVVLEEVRVVGSEDVGGVVGRNEGEVRDARVTGSVTGEGERSTGGIVGRNVGGLVTRSSSSAEVVGVRYVGGLIGRNTGDVSLSYTDGTIEGDDTVAGLVGYNLGTVRDSYSTADAEGRVTIAGLVGRNRGDAAIRNSYAAGRVNGRTEVRGLVATNSATVEGSYFDVESVSEAGDPRTDPGGTGLSTNEMTGDRARQTMTALDFDETWKTVTNPDGYPALAWQIQDVSGPGSGDGEDSNGDESNGEDGSDDGDGTDEDDGVDDGMDDEEDGDGDDGTDGDTDDGTDGIDGNDTDDETDDGTDDTGDDGGEGLPGFGVFVAVAALMAVGLSRRFDT
ncbi:MAG: GLUG motif-containing protein [Halobacteriales archaeon]|nr:GLUG motif-containing protein [Halobacteriales archaeon]